MTDLKQFVTQKCVDLIKQKGWRPFRDISVKFEKDTPAMFMAALGIATRRIQITVYDESDKMIEQLISRYRLETTTMALIEAILYFCVVHEHSHHTCCPRTKENFEAIIEGAYEVVSTKECRKERIEYACFNIHNMFSDTILNVVNSHTDTDKMEYRQGLVETYDTDLYFSLQKRRPTILGFKVPEFMEPKQDKAMTLFLQSIFLMCMVDHKAISRVRQHFPIVFLGNQRYLYKLITVFTDDEELTDQFINGNVDSAKLPMFLDRIQDTMLWKPMTVEYTKIIYQFMRQRYDQLSNSFTKPQQGSGPGQGASGGQQPQQSSGENQQQSQAQRAKDQKKTDKSAGQDDKKKKIEKDKDDKNSVKDFLEKLEQQLKDRLPTPSPLLLKFPHLDELYKRRAEKMMLSAEVGNGPNPEYVYHSGKDQMALQEFEFKNVDWSSTVVVDNQVTLFKRDMPFSLPFEVDAKEGSLPDLAFIYDSSISMKFDPIAGTGEYHYAVLAFYSILAGLESKALAYYLKYLAINFSERTISSDWQTYSRIDLVKKTIFDYQHNCTVLDPKALRHLRENRSDNVIVFMLSDTDFNFEENTQALLQEVDAMIGCGGIGLYLFQLGPPTTFSIGIEQRGLPVQYITSAQDFMNKSIQFTKDLYGEVV